MLVVAGFVTACEKGKVANIAQYEALCSEYGYAPNSSQFSKCVKRQNMIAKYENENWLILTLGLK